MSTIHDSTKASLIENTAGTLGSLLKEVFVHRKSMDHLEAEKEKEIELARARSRAQRHEDTEPVETEVADLNEPPSEAEVEAAIDELIDREMCAVCQDLLRGLKQRSTHEQVIGIMEYGGFKDSLESEAGIDELKEQIGKTEVLQSVLEENLRSPA